MEQFEAIVPNSSGAVVYSRLAPEDLGVCGFCEAQAQACLATSRGTLNTSELACRPTGK